MNDDTTNYSQYAAKVDADSNGNFVIVWSDWRNSVSDTLKVDVYCQRYSSNAIPIGNNFRINETIGTSNTPLIAVRQNGSFLVCWRDFSIRVRMYNKFGFPIGPSFIINDSLNGVYNSPSIGTDSFGNFVISWQQYLSNQNGDIYFQKIDSNGSKIGNNFKVNDDKINYHQDFPDIAVCAQGNFIITWQDRRMPPHSQGTEDIFLQRFDKYGNKIGVNEIVNDDTSTMDINSHIFPKISCDTSGAFVIAWNDDRLDNTEGEVFAQLYDKNGNKINKNFRVTRSSIDYTKALNSISTKLNGEFIISWSEDRANSQPYFQRFFNNGNYLGNEYLLTNQFSSAEKNNSDIKIWDDRILSVWRDTRNGNSDIYCNIRSYKNPDSTVGISQISHIVPEKFSLYQNFPNPFNSQTIIKFDILNKGIYSLNIYNLLGQEIDEIFTEYKTAGSYRVNYHSSDISSGIYIYSLSNGYEKLFKYFIILK